jgi:hypothetical protein
MSPHQSSPLLYRVPDMVRNWSAVRINCYAVHKEAISNSYTGVNTPSTASKALHVCGYGTAKYYATVPSLHSDRSYWSSEQLHGGLPTYWLGLPTDKNVGHPSLVNLPTGRNDPPDKEITYNCMNGSPGDPPGTVVQQSKQQMNRPFHNPSRGRSIRQGGRLGDNYRRYIICH